MSSNKPFPSSDLDVFKDNSLILDNFVNSQENEYPDRFARKRPTITGIIKEAFNVRTDISNMNETLIGQSRWDAVPKNTSLSLGGDNGALNKQAQSLFNRTELLKIHAREVLRRTYLDAGYNLVLGSFEEGGILVNSNDVLLHEKTGKCYSGPSGQVLKGTDPLVGAFVDRSNVQRTIHVSNYTSLADAIQKNRFVRSLKVIVDIDTTETTQVSFSGDLEIAGAGNIVLQSGLSALLNHSSGELKSARGIKFSTVDVNVNYNIFALISTNFTNVEISSSLDRVGIKARNPITNIFGKVKYDGVITGDFTPLPSGINEAVIFVEAADELNVDGMENRSVGCERIIKCSHGVNTFSMQHAKMRGSTKRQVVDTYINTKKVICKHNDVKMAFETFIEGKLKTEDTLPGVAPAQVVIDVSQNVFNIGTDACLRIALFQAPGGTILEPAEYDGAFIAIDNIIHGRTTSTSFDARGFTLFKEIGTIYKNISLEARPAVNIIACDSVIIKDITGDSYAVNISGVGSSQGGIAYDRTVKNITVLNVNPTEWNNTGFVFIDASSNIKKLIIDNCAPAEAATLGISTGFLYVKNSSVEKLEIKDNQALLIKSIPVRTSGVVTIARKYIGNNYWQLDSIPFESQTISTGGTVRFQIPNINGNYTGSTEKFAAHFTEDLKGCSISAYKEGTSIYVAFYNFTGANKTLDAGVIYFSTTIC